MSELLIPKSLRDSSCRTSVSWLREENMCLRLAKTSAWGWGRRGKLLLGELIGMSGKRSPDAGNLWSALSGMKCMGWGFCELWGKTGLDRLPLVGWSKEKFLNLKSYCCTHNLPCSSCLTHKNAGNNEKLSQRKLQLSFPPHNSSIIRLLIHTIVTISMPQYL